MTSRERRSILVGGGIALAAVIVLRGVPAAAAGYSDFASRATARAGLLAGMREVIAEVAELSASADSVKSDFLALAPRILAGTEAEALAGLTAQLRLASDQGRATMGRVGRQADSASAGRLRRVTVVVTYEADTRGVVGVLRAIDDAQVAIAPRALRIVAEDPASSDDSPEILTLEIVASAWYLPRRES